jgi:hypothetical protein
MLDTVKAIARAIAATNGHPDPEGYADQVAENFTAQYQPAPTEPTEPAATTEPATTA